MQAFDASPVPMVISTFEEDRILYVNDAFCENLGFAREEALGETTSSLALFDESGRAILAQQLSEQLGDRAAVLAVRKKGGQSLLGRCSTLPIALNGKRFRFSTIIDITELKEAEKARKKSEMLYRTIVDLSPDAVTVTTLDGRMINVNTQAVALYGVSSASDFTDRTVLDFVAQEEWHRAEGELLKLMFTREPHNAEYRLKRADGSFFWGEISAKMIPDAEGKPSLILILTRDITSRKRTEEELRSLAVSDDLTGLYNRRGFNLAADQELKHAHRSSQGLGLLFLDIDGLKAINDSFGHSLGDRALATVASILKKSFRESDIIARWGGDEFVVLALDVPLGCIEMLLERFVANLAHHNGMSGLDLTISISIGVAYYDPHEPLELEALVRRADAEMYLRKQGKKGKENPR